MLSNAYFLAKFRFDTAENEPAKNLQNFAKFANFADPNPLTLTPQKQPRWPAAALAPARQSRRAPSPQLRRRARRGSRASVDKIWANVARFRLYRHRFLQVSTRFAAFFKIYQII